MGVSPICVCVSVCVHTCIESIDEYCVSYTDLSLCSSLFVFDFSSSLSLVLGLEYSMCVTICLQCILQFPFAFVLRSYISVYTVLLSLVQCIFGSCHKRELVFVCVHDIMSCSLAF